MIAMRATIYVDRHKWLVSMMRLAPTSTALLWLLLYVATNPCAAQIDHSKFRTIDTSELATRIGRRGWVIVDVRDGNAFNGWVMQQEERGGHIRGATNLALAWLDGQHDDVNELVKTKLTGTNVVLYGYTAAHARRAANLLQAHAQLSPENLFIYADGIMAWSRDVALPMDRLARYEKLVPPQWVNRRLQEGKTNGYRIVEVSWRKKWQYMQNHIPGAVHLDTDEFESEPLWNLVSPERLERTLLSLGITKDTLVVLYSRDSTPAARAAVVMMYAGVSDVRLLNGGYRAWTNAGFPVASGDVRRRPETEFGATISFHPQWIIDTRQAKAVLADPIGRLVSIRSWPEYIGQTSGYAYIPRKGRIRGATWGHAGSDRNHMQDFRNPDDTMRDYHQIAENWRKWDIEPGHRLSFYCGTGWRASEAFFAAYVMGYPNISVYDGGWLEWSRDENNPVATGVPDSEPNSFP